MHDVQYRTAREADVESLVDLWWTMEAQHDEYDARFYQCRGEATCKRLCADYFRELLSDDNCLFHVAVIEEAVVGMIVAHRKQRPPLYEVGRRIAIENAVVRADHRRKGVFRGLLACIEAVAKTEGIRLITLSVDHDGSARPAYEKAGFRVRQASMIKWID